MLILLLLCSVLGAVAFRVRGGWLGDRWGLPGQASRLIYGAIMALDAVIAGWPWPFGKAALVGFFVCLTLAWFLGAAALGTLGAIDSGRNEHTRVRDFFMNALRGAVYALPPALLIAAVDYTLGDGVRVWTALALPVAGLLQGLCYEVAHSLWPMARGRRPTEAAEFMTGGCLGIGTALALTL